MKTHAPESRANNTHKQPSKQGQKPSQLGQTGNVRHPNFVKSLLWTSNRLENAIAANYALTHLIQSSISVQFYEGDVDKHSEHGQSMSHGIYELIRRSNLELDQAFGMLRAAIAGTR
jgi:hypothetical protein